MPPCSRAKPWRAGSTEKALCGCRRAKPTFSGSLSARDRKLQGTAHGSARLLSMLHTTRQSRLAMVVSCGTSRRMLSSSMLASAARGTQRVVYQAARQAFELRFDWHKHRHFCTGRGALAVPAGALNGRLACRRLVWVLGDRAHEVQVASFLLRCLHLGEDQCRFRRCPWPGAHGLCQRLP
jgi:hypothetical protein